MTNSAIPQLMSDFFVFLEQNVSCVSTPDMVITQRSSSRVKAIRSSSDPPSRGSAFVPDDPTPLSKLHAVGLDIEVRGDVNGPETETRLSPAVRAL